MIIRSLTMEDFRKYRGVHTVNLSVDWSSDKNIVLIGGLNGNGKTSLMLALRLALFGKLNDDLWRRASYRAFIADCLNRSSAAAGKREFSLSVEIETGDVAGLASLRVERIWRFSSDMGTLHELVHLYSSGRERLDLSAEEAELFILERIPYGMSRFIFFDGDRIQDLMHQETFGGQVKEAVESIFGLRIYEDLAADLVAHERSLMRLNSDDEELQRLMQAVDRAQTALVDVRAKKASLQSELEDEERRLASVQNERVRLGVNHQADRNEKDLQLAELRGQREVSQRQLATLVSFDLPYVILRPLLIDLKAKLEIEAAIDSELAVGDLLNSKKTSLLEALAETAVALDPVLVGDVWDRVFAQRPHCGTLRLRHLSMEQKLSLANQVHSLLNSRTEELERLVKSIDSIDHRIRKVQNDLRDLPKDTISIGLEEQEKVVMAGVKDILRQLSELTVEERLKEHELASLRRSEEAARLRQQLQQDIMLKVSAERTVAKAIRLFVQRVSKRKVTEVQQYLTRMFHELTRDDQVVRVFVIDPDSYDIALMDEQGHHYELGMLSEGEKQVFVLSFLWAVSMAAIEELPMVMDTPLGRLDSIHRQHIAERFFPKANRQTILLSTDTEVDGSVLDAIRPFLAKKYTLAYKSDLSTTEIEDGYFFE